MARWARRTLSPGEVVLGAETKVTFDNPFHADANTSYAVVLMTQSRFYAVRVATLGQLGQEGLVTSQVYSPGVLLESTNNETWTALQSSDLMMKIYGYNFAPQGEVRFQVYSGAAFSSFNLDEFSIQPLGTSLRWEYSTDDGVNWQAFEPGAEEQLPASRTTFWVRALMTSSRSNETPVLNFHDVHWLGYLSNTTGSAALPRVMSSEWRVASCLYGQNLPFALRYSSFAAQPRHPRHEPDVDGVHTVPHLHQPDRQPDPIPGSDDGQQPALAADSFPGRDPDLRGALR